jgi:hypothetical protein
VNMVRLKSPQWQKLFLKKTKCQEGLVSDNRLVHGEDTSLEMI